MPGPEAALRAVFRLEAERTVAIAQLVGDDGQPGAEEQLEAIDALLAEAMATLELFGVAYPLHAIARRYALGQDDYLVLQLALLPRHPELLLHALTRALGDGEGEPRLSHAVRLLAQGFDDWERAAADMLTLTVFAEQLVKTEPIDGDFILRPSQAVLELMGLDG